MRTIAAIALVATTACGTKEPPKEGGADAAATPLPACGAPISGDKPFAVTLSGSASTEAGIVGTSIDAYFPRGRVAGAPVVFTIRGYAAGSLHVRSGTLDATLSVRGADIHDPHCRDGITGDLLGPSDGLEGVVTTNGSAPSDALSLRTARVKLCASGEPRPQSVKLPPQLDPFSALWVIGTRPFDAASLATISAHSASGPVDIRTTPQAAGVSVAAATGGAFPLFAQTTIDLSGLRDVLGAPLGLGTVKTRVLTAAISDLTFATTPPDVSTIGGAFVEAGVLYVDDSAAVAIGDTSASKMRIRHRVACGVTATTTGWTVRVVNADGSTVALSPKCGGMLDEVVALSGSGPRFLSATSPPRFPGSPPCNYRSPPSSEPPTYEIDEISFE